MGSDAPNPGVVVPSAHGLEVIVYSVSHRFATVPSCFELELSNAVTGLDEHSGSGAERNKMIAA